MNTRDTARMKAACIIEIDPNQCKPHPANRRDVAHAANHVSGLKASMVEVGQLTPATIVATPNHGLLIVFGACRAEAIRQLRAEGVDIHLLAIVIEGDVALGDLMIAAEQTATLGWSQWERAELFDRLAKDMSNAQIARQLDLNKSTIGRTRNVTALPPQFLALVIDKHAIQAEPARLFNSAWKTPASGALAKHLTELLMAGQTFEAAALFESCAEVLAANESDDVSPDEANIAIDTAEAVTAALANLQAVVREQECADASDKPAEGSAEHSKRRAARIERKLEAGPRVVDVVLDGDDADVIGEASRTPTGALIITVDAVDQYPLDLVSAAITAALVRLFVS